MNILIIGCGQLGARLANVLDAQDHDIAIISRDASLFDQLDDNFSGLTIRGNPIDADVMRSAGIEGCDYIVCVTSSDNVNLMAAQIAKSFFHTEHILARVLDPSKAHIYEKLGVFTVCPTSLAFESICSVLFEQNDQRLMQIGHSTVQIITLRYEKWMKNKTLLEIEYLSRQKLLGVLDPAGRLELFSPVSNRPVQENDRMVFAEIID